MAVAELRLFDEATAIDLRPQPPDQERTSDQQHPVHLPRIKRSLRSNGVLWKAESPDARRCQGKKQRPKIPPPPDDGRNGQRAGGAHRSNGARASHPVVRRARRGKMAKPGYEQEARQYGNVDRSRHAGKINGIHGVAPRSRAPAEMASNSESIQQFEFFYCTNPEISMTI